MADFYMKKGDTAPSLDATLVNDDGTAVDLSTAQSVTFRMAHRDGPNKVNSSATIIDAANGKVRYEWAGTDTDEIGLFDAEWAVTWSGGDIETFPSARYTEIEIKRLVM